MQIHQALFRTFFPTFILLTSMPLYASDNLTADEIQSLFTGKTVEGERLEGPRQGMMNFFPESFINYFAEDGKVLSVRGDTRKSGEWRATEAGLCIIWGGDKENCVPVYKEGDHYKQQKKNNVGKIKWTKTYTRFTPGDTNGLREK